MAGINKESFFQSIGPDTVLNDEFYKKCYGYSVCDPDFLNQVAARLISINKAYAIKEYNDWYQKWEHEYQYGDGIRPGMKDVSRWYAREEWPRQWKKFLNDNQERMAEEWKQKRKELLLQKRELLSSMRN